MRTFWSALVLSALMTVVGTPVLCVAEPVKLIFDTDIGNDVDDALAMGLIHALQSRGQCELLAVTITKDQPLAAEFVDAINTFYGRGDIPIGMARSGVTPEEGKFLPLARVRDNGELRFPHDLEGDKTPEATGLLRQVLSQQPDGSVSIVQVGFSTNLARLIASAPDNVSPLSGVELVRKKVKLLSIMAGHFQPDQGGATFEEYNVKMDVASCQQLVRTWPTPIVFSGFEIGIAVPYPAVSIERDYRYVPHHPLPEAYCLYEPPPHNRPTWDLTSVLYAVFPDRGFFGLSASGSVSVSDKGTTRFTPDEKGTCRYLTLDEPQVIRVMEALVQLCSEPPH